MSLISAIRAALPDALLREAMAARRVLHMPGAIADPAAIYSPADFERALARQAFPAALTTLYLANRAVDPAIVKVADKGRYRPDALRSLLLQGATIVITQLERSEHALYQQACALEQWLRDPVTLGLVASFGTSALPLHYDSEDLLIVQLDGAKRWNFHGDPDRAAAIPSEEARNTPEPPRSSQVMMQAGDLLFVPAGQRHRCEPQGRSMHLGVLTEHAWPREVLGAEGDEAWLEQPVQRFLGELLAPDLEAAANLWRARKSRRLSLSLGGTSSEGVVAENLSLPAAVDPNGKLVAGHTAIAANAAMRDLLAALETGPKPVAGLDPAALAALLEAGYVRVT